MRKLWLLAVVAIGCCPGCRQQESRPPLDSSAGGLPTGRRPDRPQAADGRPVIACFGDSLTAGLGLDPGQTFPDLLQQDLDRRGYRYRAVNLGSSGDTTQDGLARLPLVLAEKPAIVLLELGANDGLRGLPVAGTESNLSQMIEVLQKANVKVVLAGTSLPPNYGPEYIRQFDALYRNLATKYKVPLIPFLLAGVGGNAQFMQRDGMHPNAEGTRIVETTVMKTLEPLLQ